MTLGTTVHLTGFRYTKGFIDGNERQANRRVHKLTDGCGCCHRLTSNFRRQCSARYTPADSGMPSGPEWLHPDNRHHLRGFLGHTQRKASIRMLKGNVSLIRSKIVLERFDLTECWFAPTSQ